MSRRRRRPTGRRSGTRPLGPPASAGERPLGGGSETVEQWPDGDWVVRSITGSSSTKAYRCPGCDQSILPATPHVVAWPADPGASTGFAESGVDERRHWHTPCWRARGRRRPR